MTDELNKAVAEERARIISLLREDGNVMGKYWGATESPPELDDWLDGQVAEAVKEYIADGILELKMEDPSIIQFVAAEPLDECPFERPILELITKELELYTGGDGRLQLTHQDAIGFEKLATALFDAHALLTEKLLSAEIDDKLDEDP